MTGRGEREERLILLMSPAMSWFQETEFSKNSKETSDLTQTHNEKCSYRSFEGKLMCSYFKHTTTCKSKIFQRNQEQVQETRSSKDYVSSRRE